MGQYSTLQVMAQHALALNISASQLMVTGSGNVRGFFVNSHSSGQVKIWDSLTASGTVLFNTITLSTIAVTGEHWYELGGAGFLTGLYFTITNSADLTVMWN